jgi:hypothetical protein
MSPFNPYASAWTEAIETLGLGNDENVRAKVQFEIIAKQNPPELTEVEKEVLRAGLELDNENDFGDSALALIRGEEILKKWRLAIEEGVSKGEKYEEYAKTLLPSGVLGMSDAMKIALKLVTFEIVDISKVELSPKKTKEEKAREFTVNVINSTKSQCNKSKLRTFLLRVTRTNQVTPTTPMNQVTMRLLLSCRSGWKELPSSFLKQNGK